MVSRVLGSAVDTGLRGLEAALDGGRRGGASWPGVIIQVKRRVVPLARSGWCLDPFAGMRTRSTFGLKPATVRADVSLIQSGEPRRVFEDTSPNGNLMAIAEDDGQTLYLYLHGTEESGFGVRSCWVRNLTAAPETLDTSALQHGRPPLLPRPHCAHPEGASRPLSAQLRGVWLEEGDAVALFEGDELLAVIPAWSGMDGFQGYARDCRAPSPLCAPLGTAADNPIFERIAGAERYWRRWEQDHPWEAVRDGIIDAWVAALGPLSEVFTLDFGRWPPGALVGWEREDAAIFTSVGMSVRPQPRVELYAEDPLDLCRVELAMAFSPSALSVDGVEDLMRWLGSQTRFPWSVYGWLGPGHTLPCSVAIPSALGNSFDHVICLRAPGGGCPEVALPARGDEPVHPLWLVPITASEREVAVAEGADALVARLKDAGVGWRHQDREPVV